MCAPRKSNRARWSAPCAVCNGNVVVLEEIESMHTPTFAPIDSDLPAFYEDLGLLSNTSAIGLIITEMNGNIITYNKMIHDMLGVHLDAEMPVNVCEMYANPADRDRLFALLEKSKTVRDFEVDIRYRDNPPRTVLANVDNIEWNGKQVLLTSLFDITQYKQRHKKAERSYQSLFSNAPVGITVTDVQGRLKVGNNAIRSMLGYTEEDLQNISIRDFYATPSDRIQLLALTKRLGYVRDFETRFLRKDGSVITVLINTDIIEFANTKGMLLTSIRDISDYKRVEDELVKERDFSAAILNIAATLIVVLDRDGAITQFNRACEQLTRYTFQEVKGVCFWNIPFFDPMVTPDEIQRLLKQGFLGTYNTTLVSKNQERYAVSWTFATMLDPKEQVDYVVATGIDNTKRQQAEEALQTANLELASRVEELQSRTEEMRLLNEMGEQLASCQTFTEVTAIAGQYVNQICPDNHGALYLINDERTEAQQMALWGEPARTLETFDPMACWAIRRGHPHLVEEKHPGLLCGHIAGADNGHYLCVPLMVNGQAIGILHLNRLPEDRPEAAARRDESYSEHFLQITVTIAEHIALALSNLRLRESLREQSIRDALTGLFNRRYLEETLERELMRAQREKRPVAMIMFDIDHFKHFNDSAGHDAGDALLQAVGALLNRTTRGGDIVCRYGGDECLVVLPGAGVADALRYAEELRQGVKNLTVLHRGKPLDPCTISLGVAVYPDNATDTVSLLKAADTAMYQAKNQGRDRVAQA